MSDDSVAYRLGKFFWSHRYDKSQYTASLAELSDTLPIQKTYLGAELSNLKNKKRILGRRKPNKDEGRAERYFLMPDVTEADIEALNGSKITLSTH